MSKDGDLELALTMQDRGVVYPIGPYPEIQEFGAMLNQLEAGHVWDGVLFEASGQPGGEHLLFRFCRRADRVLFTFVEEEWMRLKETFSRVIEAPEVQSVTDRLSLEYGEV